MRAKKLRADLERMACLEPGASASRDAVVAFLDAYGEAGLDRAHHDPGHVTASALVVDSAGGRVLLVLHRFLGCWLQPGGHVDAHDASVLHAALREVREETGLVTHAVGGPLHVDVHRIPARPLRAEPSHLHLDVRWLVRASAEVPQAGDDAAEARWFRWEDVSSIDTDDSVRALVEAGRRAVDRHRDAGRASDDSCAFSSANRDRRG